MWCAAVALVRGVRCCLLCSAGYPVCHPAPYLQPSAAVLLLPLSSVCFACVLRLCASSVCFACVLRLCASPVCFVCVLRLCASSVCFVCSAHILLLLQARANAGMLPESESDADLEPEPQFDIECERMRLELQATKFAASERESEYKHKLAAREDGAIRCTCFLVFCCRCTCCAAPVATALLSWLNVFFSTEPRLCHMCPKLRFIFAHSFCSEIARQNASIQFVPLQTAQYL